MEKQPTLRQPRSLLTWLWPHRAGRGSARFLHRGVFEGVLGTTLELQIATTSSRLGEQLEAEVLNEIDRLEAIFSQYDLTSEFNCWQRTFDQDAPISPELAQVLAKSEMWRAKSENAFNPAVEALSQFWKIGAQTGTLPDKEELEPFARAIGTSLWSVDIERCSARRLTTHRASLNSVAKGFIVDRACRVAQREGVEDVLLNIGGDLRHAGRNGVTVGVANPSTLADNAPPVARVRLHNASLATSGRARRGFQIGQQWFSHVLDPRTGWPVAGTVSASVLAADALCADVLATICSVIAPEEALQLADSLPETGIYLQHESGQTTSNAFWRTQAV